MFLKKTKRGIFISTVVLFTSIIGYSCGSGSSTKNDSGGSVFSGGISAVAKFTPDGIDCSTPPPNSIYMCMNRSLSSDDEVAVDVILNTENPVFGIAFDIEFDSERAILSAKKEDQSLDSSSAEERVWRHAFVSIQADNYDRVVAGASLARGDSSVAGIIHVITLKFNLRGNSQLTFINNNLLAETGKVIDADLYNWYGGTLGT